MPPSSAPLARMTAYWLRERRVDDDDGEDCKAESCMVGLLSCMWSKRSRKQAGAGDDEQHADGRVELSRGHEAIELEATHRAQQGERDEARGAQHIGMG